MFIFQSKFNNPPLRDRITEKSGTSKKNQWDFHISKVGSLDFLNFKVNGSPDSDLERALFDKDPWVMAAALHIVDHNIQVFTIIYC